ncbi:MAG: hypothetical protein PHS07_02585 [Patescibacteria group bacterium]|nr:hypothetical protein [Patescibacteria group bacterium]
MNETLIKIKNANKTKLVTVALVSLAVIGSVAAGLLLANKIKNTRVDRLYGYSYGYTLPYSCINLPPLKGDANCNGKYDKEDFNLIQTFIKNQTSAKKKEVNAKKSCVAECFIKANDMNSDHFITVKDAQLVKKLIR